MRKSHLNVEFLVLLGPIISRFFACSNEEKNKGACSSPISMHTIYAKIGVTSVTNLRICVILDVIYGEKSFVGLDRDCFSVNLKVEAGNPYRRERISTLCLLVLTSLC
jgi:hypothetical protein